MIECFQVLPIVSLHALGRGRVQIPLGYLQQDKGQHLAKSKVS
jgi:hypothetical protein